MPNTMDLTGRVLSNRYRLISGVGMGSSGVVYSATDVNLKRQVAVKVLHRGYNADLAFLRRFRAKRNWQQIYIIIILLQFLTGAKMKCLI
jgi:serine/threonine protein kinase